MRPRVASRTRRAKTGWEDSAFVAPMLAKAVESVPKAGDFVYELKLDGYRILAVKDARGCRLYSRTALDMSQKYPLVVQALAALPVDEVTLDGEVVALDEHGRPSFERLQAYEGNQLRSTLVYYAFDVLRAGGADLTGFALRERRQVLELVCPPGEVLRISSSLGSDGNAVLREIAKLDLEGIVGKRWSSKYEAGRRSGAWIKLKVQQTDDFVIGGYSDPEGARPFFGALVLGRFAADGRLVYAGRVGSGLSDHALASLHAQFQSMGAACPFAEFTEPPPATGYRMDPSELRACHWLRPTLVCRVRYQSLLSDGIVRHPVFEGLRDDVDAASVRV